MLVPLAEVLRDLRPRVVRGIQCTDLRTGARVLGQVADHSIHRSAGVLLLRLGVVVCICHCSHLFSWWLVEMIPFI